MTTQLGSSPLSAGPAPLSALDAPFVSVIIPCQNEEKFIGPCLDSILTNDYPSERMEVLVIDGMSSDRTRAILAEIASRDPRLRILDNPRKITPVALNLGIGHSHGEIILRMDAHARINPDYISRCVDAMRSYGADNVGGIMVTLSHGNGIWAQSFAQAISHRFGVGNSVFRTHTDKPRWVDTVFGGCYRKTVFSRVGLYNEKLVRSQDMELNRRLRKAGGTILLDPSIVAYYYAKPDFFSFLRHNWTNGTWSIVPFLYSDIMPVSWRHLVPMTFLTGLIGMGLLALLWRPAAWPFAAAVVLYILANLAASAWVATRERDLRFVGTMPAAFAALHFAYGAGSIFGGLRVLAHLGRIRRDP
jgi:glycosyltransferase involved in cell wall biosynthesis